MTELEVYVDKDALIYLILKKAGKFFDIMCLPNFEEPKSVFKSTQLTKDLRIANKRFCRICPDKLTVECEYPPFSSESIRKFVTYTEGALYE